MARKRNPNQGVSYLRKTGRWQAYVTMDKRMIGLGSAFLTEEEAVEARNRFLANPVIPPRKRSSPPPSETPNHHPIRLVPPNPAVSLKDGCSLHRVQDGWEIADNGSRRVVASFAEAFQAVLSQ